MNLLWSSVVFPCTSSLVRCIVGVVFIVVSLIALGPILFQVHGDAIMTKLLFQSWCEYPDTFLLRVTERVRRSLARYYPWIDLTKPKAFGLNGVNVYEPTGPDVTVGLW